MTNGLREREPNGIWILLAVVLTVMAILMLSSCSPRIIESVRYQHDTTYVERVRVDSIYKRDSVLIHQKGDTVFVYKEKIRERWRLLRDTIRVVKVDSIAVERIKEIKVDKPLSLVQRAKLGLFWWLLAAVVALGGWTFRKQLIPIIKMLLKI